VVLQEGTGQVVATGERPLDGIRVIELGQLLAGPFCGAMLAYFGAEVIKIEPPGGGDAIRGWREVQDGTSLWWYSIGRNKKSVTLDLRIDEGRDVARRLMETADVVIENFRPGVMEGWGLGPEQLRASNPGLVFARISGYGQDGPNSHKPGYASVTEGFSGFRYLNGFPGEAPVRPNLSIGDTISAIHATLGIVLALLQRGKTAAGTGQVVDVALYESMFNLMESVVPEYDGAGVVRQPSGTTITGIVPTNTYRCRDGRFVIIGGNGDSIFKRLMIAAGRPDMAADPALAHNAGRVAGEPAIDAALSAWCARHDAAHIIAVLEAERVPAGPIYTVEDMVGDPHFQARGMFEQVDIGGRSLKIPAILPKLGATPGRTDWPGPVLGSHTDEVLGTLLGLAAADLEGLRARGVI
jgi:crotonobetainyl-CoA:carnitine CoA-transferase CaiB-like acyl-CoA transferase